MKRKPTSIPAANPSEVERYHYKVRSYSPRLGRFMQTDPIGYEGGMNLYAYVGNDPVNRTDPSGLQMSDIVVNATRDALSSIMNDLIRSTADFSTLTSRQSLTDLGFVSANGMGQKHRQKNWDAQEIVVTAYWRKQQAAGNPIAGLGLQFCYSCSADWSTTFARQWLIGAIAHQPINGRYPSASQVRTRFDQIRVALMNADQAARLADTTGVRGLLSAGQVYDYHVAVFGSFGISSSNFGGSLCFGTRTESILSAGAGVWCSGCDR